MRILNIILSILIANTLSAQESNLIQPDTAKLNSIIYNQIQTESIGYVYLKTNYDSIGSKLPVEVYEWDDKRLCAFHQRFELGIRYHTNTCKEGGGLIEKIRFPAGDMAAIKSIVEKLYAGPGSSWVDELNFEADGAGCYVTLIPNERWVILDVYCGC